MLYQYFELAPVRYIADLMGRLDQNWLRGGGLKMSAVGLPFRSDRNEEFLQFQDAVPLLKTVSHS